MKRLFFSLILLVGSVMAAQNIPQELVGKWVIQRELPTRTISCWGEKEAKAIIGTEIEYTADSFRWKHIVVKHPTVAIAVVSAEQFQRENSSPSVNGSQVSFRQLGIDAPEMKQVSINHEPARDYRRYHGNTRRRGFAQKPQCHRFLCLQRLFRGEAAPSLRDKKI